jgi:hypothetical protein
MGYYMGDYYRGDYYRGRGDPGLFGTILGGIKKVAGAVLRRTPVGMAIGAVSSILPQLPAPRSAGGGLNLPGPFRVSPTAIIPGGRPFLTREGGAVRSGYHLDKRTGTYEVRNRSMNPANPRALRRAIRREKGFVALARRVLRGTGMTISRKGMSRKGKRRK